MSVLLGTVFVASLIGSLHCAGMCGPFLAFAVSDNGRLAPRGLGRHIPQAVYHLARLIAYVALGALFGTVGALVNASAEFAGIQHAAMLLAGALLVLMGIVSALGQFVRLGPRIAAPRGPRAILAAGVVRASKLPPAARAASVGLLTALLPCGWLYGFALAAAGTESAATGGALMLAFWAGTLPMLAGLAWVFRRAERLLAARIQVAASLALVLIGAMTVWARVGALDSLPTQPPPRSASAEAIAAEVKQLDSAKSACCQGRP